MADVETIFSFDFYVIFLLCLVLGTLKERGMIEWQAELGVDIPNKTESSEGKNKELSRKDKRTINVSKVIYDIPFFPRFMLSWRLIKYIPVFPSRRLS